MISPQVRVPHPTFGEFGAVYRETGLQRSCSSLVHSCVNNDPQQSTLQSPFEPQSRAPNRPAADANVALCTVVQCIANILGCVELSCCLLRYFKAYDGHRRWPRLCTRKRYARGQTCGVRVASSYSASPRTSASALPADSGPTTAVCNVSSDCPESGGIPVIGGVRRSAGSGRLLHLSTA